MENTIINDKLYIRNTIKPPSKPWTKEEFLQEINNLSYRYHINHPLDKYFMEGKASKELMKSWVANRFYYQSIIPKKDSAILSNCPDQSVRQKWILNVLDHDNDGEGIDLWIDFAKTIDLTKEELLSQEHVLPGVKFACDAYYNFAKNNDYKIAIASCLTVNYAGDIHKARVDNWPKYYDWLDKDSYVYFRDRMSKVKHEKDTALNYVLEWFKTPEEQAQVLETIKFKQDVLWSILDNIFVYHFTNFYDVMD